LHRHVEPVGDHRVLQPIRSQQHDLRPHHLVVRRRVGPGALLQRGPVYG